MNLEYSRQFFEKYINIKYFMTTRPSRVVLMWMDGRTDGRT